MTNYCKRQIIKFLQWLLKLLDPPALVPSAGRYRVRPELAAAVGSADAAVLVDRLAYWLRRNAAENKTTHFVNGRWWSYNSYQAWADDALPWLSGDQVRRIFVKLEKLGVVQGIALKGRGKPKWYSIDDTLLATLTGAESPKTTLTKSPDTLANLPGTLTKSPDTPANLPASSIESNLTNPSPEIQLDLLPPTTPERSEAILISEWAEVFGKARATTQTQIAAEVARIGLAQAREVAQRCADSQGKSWQYVLAALRNETPPPTPLPTPVAAAPREMGEAAWQDWLNRMKAAEKPPRVAVVKDRSWDIAFAQLEIQLDKATWSAWVRDLLLVKVEGGAYTLDAPNRYAQEMVQHRLYRTIWRVLSDVAGRDVTIEVVVGDSAMPSVQPLRLMRENASLAGGVA